MSNRKEKTSHIVFTLKKIFLTSNYNYFLFFLFFFFPTPLVQLKLGLQIDGRLLKECHLMSPSVLFPTYSNANIKIWQKLSLFFHGENFILGQN